MSNEVLQSPISWRKKKSGGKSKLEITKRCQIFLTIYGTCPNEDTCPHASTLLNNSFTVHTWEFQVNAYCLRCEVVCNRNNHPNFKNIVDGFRIM